MTQTDESATSWAEIPDDVEIADGVDLDAPDPALVTDDGERPRRQCIARRRKDGARCTAGLPKDSLLCAPHAGTMDASAGGRAAAENRREARERAEAAAAGVRLGLRAAITEELHSQQAKVRRALRLLIEDAQDTTLAPAERRRAALAVLPYVDQGLGKPTERVEHTSPSSTEELEGMSTQQLADLVAQGRARRLQAVPEPEAGTG